MTMSLFAAKYFGRSATHLPNSMGRIGTCSVPSNRLSTLAVISSACPCSADEHLVNLYDDLAADVGSGRSDEQSIFAGIDHPTVCGVVPSTERSAVETERYLSRLTGRDGDFRPGLERLGLAWHRRRHRRDVTLNDDGCITRPGRGHRHCHLHRVASTERRRAHRR